jgi:hypothetical protein
MRVITNYWASNRRDSGSRVEADLSAEAKELRRKGLTDNGSVGSQLEECQMRGRWQKLRAARFGLKRGTDSPLTLTPSLRVSDLMT